MNDHLSPSRATALIKEQLADLEKVKSSFDNSEPLDFSERMTLQSFKRLEDELKEELRAAELKESEGDLELSFDGEHVKKHGINFDFFETVLKPLNEIWKIASKKKKIVDAKAPRIVESFRILAFVPSSFAVRIAFPKSEEPESLFDEGVSFETQLFADIFSNNIDAGAPHFQDPEIRKRYKEVFSILAKSNSSLAVRTKISPFATKFSKKAICQRIEKIKHYEAIQVDGKIVMGDLTQDLNQTRQQGFKVEAGIVTFLGKMRPSAIENLRLFPLGSSVKASILLPDGEDVEKAVNDSKVTEGTPRNIPNCQLLSLELNQNSGN